MSKATKEALAYALAKDAHEGQLYGDKDYFEYYVLGVASEFNPNCEFLHRRDRVCIKCNRDLSTLFSSNGCKSYDHEAYMVALLNHVFEGVDFSLDAIDALFGEKIRDAVSHITKYPSESYVRYISVLKRNKLAAKVKIADLKFNLSQPDTKSSLVKRYTEALAVLEGMQCLS